MKFGRLTSKDDYVAVAELVYQTDAYLYPDLFGSVENAIKILPFLLEDKKSTWYKDYIYIAKENGVVVGIVTILPHNVDWDFTSVRMAYMEAGLELDDKVRAVCEYFSNAFSHIGVGSNACNVCVHPEYRGKGIASFMIKKVIELAGDNNIELSVLADNVAAIRLYEKHGFLKIKEYLDYGGYNQPEILCNYMVRIGGNPPA